MNNREPIIRKSVGLHKVMWGEISDFQRGERIATESEAVRRLIQAGLGSRPKLKRKAKRQEEARA